MDSAKTRKDEGTFWAPEDRSWLWYNDTIETHAFALRTLMELDPKSDKRDGLVLWLLLNKKLNQWKTTRATAEVIYALVHYLKKEGALGIRESARVTVAGKTTEIVFEPDVYTGKQQVVIPGGEVGEGDVDGDGGQGDEGLRLRQRDLELLDRAATEGGSRRLLQRCRAATSSARREEGKRR